MIRCRFTYMIAALLLLTSACSDELRTDSPEGGEGSDGSSFLKLTIHCPTATGQTLLRSDLPTGGEPGDGDEAGQDYENRIDNFMLLFYQGESRSNSSAGTPIDKIMYFDREEITDGSDLISVNLPAGEYDLLVITNTGDMRSSLQGKNLGEIRDYLLTWAWQESDGEYSRFVMTSDGHTEDRVTLCGNPESNPANAVVEVERLAARIDYQAVRTVYEVNDTTYGAATVSIVGGVIVNKMKAGSYLLKRVADPDGDNKLVSQTPVTFLADEIPSEGGVQRNYVVDPWSYLKTAANATASVFSPAAPGSGNRPVSELYENYYTSFGGSVANWEKAIVAGTPIDGWMRLGYTMENTVSRENQIDAYTTFAVFKARYTPTGFNEGQTFYVRDGKIYRTREEAEQVNSTKPIREYKDGNCYYTWRIRHSNDGDDSARGIMEYAIVRNNIYKLRISDIYALGDEIPFPAPDPMPTPTPTPTPDPVPDPEPNPDPEPEPEPEPEKEKVRINIEVIVEKWTTLADEHIYL